MASTDAAQQPEIGRSDEATAAAPQPLFGSPRDESAVRQPEAGGADGASVGPAPGAARGDPDGLPRTAEATPREEPGAAEVPVDSATADSPKPTPSRFRGTAAFLEADDDDDGDGDAFVYSGTAAVKSPLMKAGKEGSPGSPRRGMHRQHPEGSMRTGSLFAGPGSAEGDVQNIEEGEDYESMSDGQLLGKGKIADACAEYQALCSRLRMPAKPLACVALKVLDHGGEALPKEFSRRCYLGNREAEAFFVALNRGGARHGNNRSAVPGEASPGGVELFAQGEGERSSSSRSHLSNLRRLDLAGQGLANEAAWALADMLPLCTQLSVLDVRRNLISEKGAYQLLKVIQEHHCIREVHIEGNPTPSFIRVRLAETLSKRNNQLKNKEQVDPPDSREGAATRSEHPSSPTQK